MKNMKYGIIVMGIGKRHSSRDLINIVVNVESNKWSHPILYDKSSFASSIVVKFPA